MSDDIHSRIASGAIGQNNHPTHASSIGATSGGGGLEVFPGAGAASLDKITSGTGIPTPLPQNEHDLMDSMKPGAFGQDPVTQTDGALTQFATSSPSQNGIGQLENMHSETKNFNPGQYIGEVNLPKDLTATGRGVAPAA